MPWTINDVDRFKRGLSENEKRQWVRIANSTLEKCKERNPNNNCEARAIRQANGVVGNVVNTNQSNITLNNYEIRYEEHQNERHLVVPVVMMTEGVHNGSHGSLYHPADELGKYPDSWNGIPVSVLHPEMDGYNVSANSPDIIDSQVVGRVYNTRLENGALKSEAWLKESDLLKVSPEAYVYLLQGKPLEVSLGMFTDDDPIEGNWNGENYIGVARNHRPDHLALLPGQVGACSWDDGCGVRSNQLNVNKKRHDPIINQDGLRSRIDKLSRKLDAMDTRTMVNYLEEVYDDYIVYRVESVEGSRSAELYKRGYTMIDGEVELSNNVVPVRKEISYVEISNNRSGGNTVNKEQKVNLLIQNEHSVFEEKDKEWLQELDEEKIDKFIEMQNDKAQSAEQKPTPITKEKAVEVLSEQLSDPNKFMNLLPKEVRAQMEHGIQLLENHRSNIIQKILACGDGFTEDELGQMETSHLEKLAKYAKAPVDYSAQGSGKTQVNTVKEEPLLPIVN